MPSPQKLSIQMYNSALNGKLNFGFVLLFISLLFVLCYNQALAQNPGFENNTIGWTAAGEGSWSICTKSGLQRSGKASAQLFTDTNVYGKVNNLSFTVTTPAIGTTYVAVIAYAHADNSNNLVAAGVYDISRGMEYMGSNITATTIAGGWTRISFIFKAIEGTVYSPMLYGSSSVNGSAVNIYFDDVVIYTNDSSSIDFTPPSKASGIAVSTSGALINMSWIAGKDNLSGVTGTLILRQNGLIPLSPIVNNQTDYSTNSLVGPKFINTWKVVSNGDSSTSFSNNPGSLGAFTYLIYMRDKAYNYSAVARLYVINDSLLSESVVESPINLDGLYIPKNNYFIVSSTSTVNFLANANVKIDGVLQNNNIINADSYANIVFTSNGIYEHHTDAFGNSIPLANWESGSVCLIDGTVINAPYGINQSFYNFEWDCTSQITSSPIFDSATFNGLFQLKSTGIGEINLIGTGNSFKSDVTMTAGTLNFIGKSSTMTLNGSSQQYLNMKGGSRTGIMNLTVNNNNGVYLNSNLTCNGAILLESGIFDISGNNLTIDSGAGVIRQTGGFTGTPVFSKNNYVTYLSAVNTGSEIPGTQGVLGKLTINCDGEVFLSSAADVNDSLFLINGFLDLGNNDLTIVNAGSISGASTSSFVITVGHGRLRQNNIGPSGATGTVFFPVGSSPAGYNPVGIKNTGTTDDYYVHIINNYYSSYAPDGTPEGNPVSNGTVTKTWYIEEGTPGGSDVSLTLQWNNDDASIGFSPVNCYMTHYYDNEWNNLGITQAEGSNPYTITATGITSFSPFGVAGTITPLPVQLVSFNAIRQINNAFLLWTTASETNNNYFAIERSLDGIIWKNIGQVAGNGTTNELHNYNFTDSNIEFLLTNVIYYRLKQVDYNGNFVYSPIRQVTIGSSAVTSETKVWFNRDEEWAVVQLERDANARLTITLLDLQGKAIASQQIETNPGINQYNLDLQGIAKGMYVVNINDGNGYSFSNRILKY